MEEIVFGSV